MVTRKLGKSELNVSPVIMGTWQAGKNMWVGIEDRQIKAAVEKAFDAGITTFDTAEVYGDGHSERVLGEAIAPFRKQATITTKVFSNHLSYEGVLNACHGSLRRLKTDYIDLYQIHWPAGTWNSPQVPIDETMRAFADLRRQGKIRAIGVSNFTKRQLQDAIQCDRVDSIQPPFSLFWRHVERDIMPFCVDHQISILAYSPLAQGLLTGKFGPDHVFEEGDHRSQNRLFQIDHYLRVQEALERLRPLAQERQITMAKLALAWLMAQPQTSAIVGVRRPDQIQDNAGAMTVSLSKQELDQIDAIGKTVTDFLDDNPVMWQF